MVHTSLPTFMVFKNGKQTEKIEGAAVPKLKKVIQELAQYAEGATGSSSGSSASWSLVDLPRGYSDITSEVDLKGLELLNNDDEFGTVRRLISDDKPSALDGKGKATEKKDWVESDTDEQLMMFIPFQATVKIHTLQVGGLRQP